MQTRCLNTKLNDCQQAQQIHQCNFSPFMASASRRPPPSTPVQQREAGLHIRVLCDRDVHDGCCTVTVGPETVEDNLFCKQRSISSMVLCEVCGV